MHKLSYMKEKIMRKYSQHLFIMYPNESRNKDAKSAIVLIIYK